MYYCGFSVVIYMHICPAYTRKHTHTHTRARSRTHTHTHIQ